MSLSKPMAAERQRAEPYVQHGDVCALPAWRAAVLREPVLNDLIPVPFIPPRAAIFGEAREFAMDRPGPDSATGQGGENSEIDDGRPVIVMVTDNARYFAPIVDIGNELLLRTLRQPSRSSWQYGSSPTTFRSLAETSLQCGQVTAILRRVHRPGCGRRTLSFCARFPFCPQIWHGGDDAAVVQRHDVLFRTFPAGADSLQIFLTFPAHFELPRGITFVNCGKPQPLQKANCMDSKLQDQS
jgi:hypothetical protein